MESVRQNMTRLREAAIEGSVTLLRKLLYEDTLILDRCIMSTLEETPLHIAAMLGHLEFSKEILSRKPELAKELDFQGASPLHVATASGHLEVVEALLVCNPDMCLSVDNNFRSPLHIAVIKRRLEVLKRLVEAKPEAARITTNGGETILQVCVRHNQLEALKFLVETLNDQEFINSKDYCGITALQLAASEKRAEIINFLVSIPEIEVNTSDGDSFTLLDIEIAQNGRNVREIDIQEALERDETAMATGVMENKYDWLENMRSALIVVASLIATMAFQIGTNPPGGAWQEDVNGQHVAGTAIMVSKDPSTYVFIVVYNTMGFLASLCVILLLISGLPLKGKLSTWILMIIMWFAVTSMSVSYFIALSFVSRPYRHSYTPDGGSAVSRSIAPLVIVILWFMGLAILFFGHSIRLIKRLKCFG